MTMMTAETTKKLYELENKFRKAAEIFKDAPRYVIYFSVLSDNVTEERELKFNIKDVAHSLGEENAKIIIRALEREIKKYAPEKDEESEINACPFNDDCIFTDCGIEYSDAKKMCHANKYLAKVASILLEDAHSDMYAEAFDLFVSVIVDAVVELSKEKDITTEEDAMNFLLDKLDEKIEEEKANIFDKVLSDKMGDSDDSARKIMHKIIDTVSNMQTEVQLAVVDLATRASLEVKMSLETYLEFSNRLIDAAKEIDKKDYGILSVDRARLDLIHKIDESFAKENDNNSVDNVKEKIKKKKAIASSIVNNSIITEAVLDLIDMATIQFKSLDTLNDFIEDVFKAAKYICNNIYDIPKTVSEAKDKLFAIILNRSYDKIKSDDDNVSEYDKLVKYINTEVAEGVFREAILDLLNNYSQKLFGIEPKEFIEDEYNRKAMYKLAKFAKEFSINEKYKDLPLKIAEHKIFSSGIDETHNRKINYTKRAAIDLIHSGLNAYDYKDDFKQFMKDTIYAAIDLEHKNISSEKEASDIIQEILSNKGYL